MERAKQWAKQTVRRGAQKVLRPELVELHGKACRLAHMLAAELQAIAAMGGDVAPPKERLEACAELARSISMVRGPLTEKEMAGLKRKGAGQ